MKVKWYRTQELLDSIFDAVYPDIWADDLRNVRKMYRACDTLLNAPERPWQAYEKAMNTFDRCLKKYVAEMNTITKPVWLGLELCSECKVKGETNE